MTDETYIELLKAIREHSGMELSAIQQAGEHGADAGWPGFTYTRDAADFFEANRDTIWNMAADDADDMGAANVAAFVGAFNRADMTETPDGFECLLSWYALEAVGRRLSDRQYERNHA